MMKTYQFIILLGTAFGILFNGLALIIYLSEPANSEIYHSQLYILLGLLVIYAVNIATVFLIGNSKIVGIISIISSISIILFFAPMPPGISSGVILLIGGILAIIRKPNR